ncbi:hypothetical protein DAEQUDRAFT_725229 [Daedalea quercina L-15889]|uniref:Uncharacterized protein n=1 Tax=Daedalea quercina L-15889 TaxID=1314783 RepID=A0A165RFD4_9APHY|nr:hypothetical protein DAEQUDRAFT_725229 [Daedalea quercina L-15889]
MQITVYLHYRGTKSFQMRQLKDDTARYLEEFVNKDLTSFGLPAPQECTTAWRSGIIRCIWSVEEGSYLQSYICIAFKGISSLLLPDLSLSMIGLSLDGKQTYITAQGVKNPAPPPKTSSSLATYTHRLGKAPGAPKSIMAARLTASPMAHHAHSIRHSDDGSEMHPPATGIRLGMTTQDNGYAGRSSARAVGDETAIPSPSGISGNQGSMSVQSSYVPPQPHSKCSESIAMKLESEAAAPDADTELENSISASTSSGAMQPRAPSVHSTVHDPPPSPSRSSISSSSQAAPSILSARSAAISATSATSDASAATLTREISDVRREIYALSARDIALSLQLKRLGARPPPRPPAETPGPAAATTQIEDEISDLRAQLKAESEARAGAESALREERRRRELAEAVVADARRECKVPFVVPALMDALMDMSRLTGDVLDGVNSERSMQVFGV